MSAEREAAEVLGELVANIEQALASGQAAAFPAPSAWAETATTIRAALAALAAAAGGREAEAWDAGYACGLREDIAVEMPTPNPYRTGGSDD